MAWKMFPWVPDGIYDKRDFLVRYKVVDGCPTTVISKMWVDSGGPAEIEPEMVRPWGVYPDLPPKPPK